MSIPYDVFTNAFLSKVTEYEFINMDSFDRNSIMDEYMKHAISSFERINKYKFANTGDDKVREFNIDIAPEDLDEIVDIISEGMLVYWMKPYIYKQEVLENILNTRDYTTYSPAELLMRLRNAYSQADIDFKHMMRAYSYAHGDLTDLHL